MQCSSRTKLFLILSFLCLVSLPVPAQYVQQIGLDLFQATTTNLNGSGITVGQPEADDSGGASNPPEYEVSPTAISQYSGLITYISSNGAATVFPNSVGYESGHADTVAANFYGMPSGVATNVAYVYNYDADYYIDHLVENNQDTYNESVVNQSFTFGALTISGQEGVDSDYDNYEEMHHTLFISAVGPGAPDPPYAPGTAYNCISVGGYQNGQNYSDIGPTIDNGRCKPDISGYSAATSFSTPLVAGAAAVLMQAALRRDGGTDTNSAFNNRTIKALLLNGAVKPVDWTNSALFPLDARYGAGVVNVFNSYRLLAAGKHGSVISNEVSSGSAHPPLAAATNIATLCGWDFNTNNSSSSPASDAIYHYYFNVSNQLAGVQYVATATLVWNRHKNQSAINNLDLFLYNCANSNLVACSTSLVNNVEHIYLTNLSQGRYDLQVWKLGTNGIVSTAEPYALAWQFTANRLDLNKSGVNAVLTWPLFPAGFLVQATTSLTVPVWTNIDLSSLIFTNNTNSLTFPAVNGPLFFRLSYPNL